MSRVPSMTFLEYHLASEPPLPGKEPAGTAHAVLNGTQVTVCGLGAHQVLVWPAIVPWDRTELPRCPACASRAT